MSDAPLLPVGDVASLRYGPRFSREKLQLLEVDDALLDEIVRRGVVIKGAPDQEAVLCTATQTFALKKLYENSNELLLIPPVRTRTPCGSSASLTVRRRAAWCWASGRKVRGLTSVFPFPL